MKLNIFSTLLICILFSLTANAQETISDHIDAEKTEVKKDTFNVYGNCGMCERRIEGAAKKIEGVEMADWDMMTWKMIVSYDPLKTSLDEIKQTIADVGYDSKTHRAKDEIYNMLPGCCKYKRPE